MRPNLLKPIVAALAVALSSAAFAAPTSYHFRQFVPGLSTRGTVAVAPAAPATPSMVGDGVSKVGACASGTTGCATWNSGDGYLTLSADKLVATCAVNGWHGHRATIGKSAGKWYWELTINQVVGGSTIVGAVAQDASLASIMTVGQYLWWPGQYYLANGAFTDAGISNAWLVPSRNTVIGMALDMDSKTIVFSQGTSVLASAPVVQSTLVPSGWCASPGSSVTANFGQVAFQYPVPAGYNAGLW